MIDSIKTIENSQSIVFYGFKIVVFPRVYYPSDDSYMIADFLYSLNNEYEYGLDIGCGCGILTLMLTRICKHVIAIDVSSLATKNTFYNVKLNGLQQKVSVIRGDLITSIKFKPIFDIITFNPPYLPMNDFDKYVYEEELRMWCGGFNGRLLVDRFLDTFKNILKPSGEVLLLQSSLSDHKKTIDKLTNMGFKISIISEKSFFYEKLYLFKVTLA
ncbi:MAG: methyltransferase [Candidatus Methanomethylicia archaeon]